MLIHSTNFCNCPRFFIEWKIMISSLNINPFGVPKEETKNIIQLESSQYQTGAVVSTGGFVEPTPMPATRQTPVFMNSFPDDFLEIGFGRHKARFDGGILPSALRPRP